MLSGKKHIQPKTQSSFSTDAVNDYKSFFNNYYSRLVNFALYFVKSHENAEDVIEEVFYKFLKKKPDISKIENLDAYLFRMTKNESLNLLKKNKYLFYNSHLENSDDFHVHSPSPHQQMECSEFENMIAATIEKFPPKRKTIFKLSREENMPYSEIADLLDVSVKTVESHMTVALKILRVFVMEYDKSMDTTMRKISR